MAYGYKGDRIMRSAIALLLLAPALAAAQLVPPSPMPDLVRIIDDVNGERWYIPFQFDVILASDESHPGVPGPGIGTGYITVASYLPDGTLELVENRVAYSARWTQRDIIGGTPRVTLYVIADPDAISGDSFESEFVWSEYQLSAGCNPRVEDCRR